MPTEDNEILPKRRVDITFLLWSGIILHATIFLLYVPGIIFHFLDPNMIQNFLGPSYKEFLDQSIWKHLIFLLIDGGLCFFAYELIYWKKRGFIGLLCLFMLLIGMSLERENWPIFISDILLAVIFSQYYFSNEKYLE